MTAESDRGFPQDRQQVIFERVFWGVFLALGIVAWISGIFH